MVLHTPSYWDKTSVLSILLVPVSWLYYAIVWCRYRWVKPYRATVPVICIGNVTAGGAGKTPVAIALAKLALAKGITPCFLSRGYGGTLAGPVKVDPEVHKADEVGDEPLLLAKIADTWICRNRKAGAMAAAASGVGLIIMDDGFQNPSLHKACSLLVIDGSKGVGNGHMLPAGPLREPLKAALKRANKVVIIGEDKHNLAARMTKPVIKARLVPEPTLVLHKKRYVAFAGIGNPAKFFTSLEEAGAEMLEKLAFPDHYPYTEKDMALLRAKAAALGAMLITTEKDAMRLPEAMLAEIEIFPVTIAWDDEEQVISLLW